MSNLSRSIVLAAASIATAAVALPASAQTYVQGYGGQTYSNGYYGQPAYQSRDYRDYRSQPSYECDRQRQGRTGAGAVIGGGAGAVVGSQLAARGRRTEGSILGGVLGAVVGGAVGRSSSEQCYDRGSYSYGQPSYSSGYSSYSQPYSSSSSYRYSSGANVYYDQNGYGPYRADDRRYDDRRDDRRYDDRRYDDGRYDRRDLQVSPDGRYVYDPNHGWVPR